MTIKIWIKALAIVAFSALTCTSTVASAKTVGICMPTRDNARWIREAEKMAEVLKADGIDTEIQFANNDTATQVNQIENLITKGVDALIISSVDGSALTSVLDEAKGKNIPIIAYTRLITGTDAVSYYSTFDYYAHGRNTAQALLQGLGLVDASGKSTGKKGPFNIEYFSGSPTDNVARYMYDAATETFKPFLDSGDLKVASGQTSFEQTVTSNWDGGAAQSRMENILTSAYTGGRHLDGAWSPYDGMTRGLISALQDAGYSVGPNWPILTGGDAEIDSVKAILAGEQYSTAYPDFRALAEATGRLVAELLRGDKPSASFDTKTYNNGAKTVPTLLYPIGTVKKEDVRKDLVDSGFYTKEQLGLK